MDSAALLVVNLSAECRSELLYFYFKTASDSEAVAGCLPVRLINKVRFVDEFGGR
jgi:hypothetical protein